MSKVSTTRELQQKVPEGRPARQRMTRRNRLAVVNRDPDYHYRIVNDVDDRIEAAKAAGYEVDVTQPRKGADARVDVPAGVGSATISVGGGLKAVVMRIRKDWYQEDQRAKMDEIDTLERSMKQSAKTYVRGEFDIESNSSTEPSLKV